MKLTTVTLHKQLKIGLPDYSNITVGMHLSFDIGEDEEMDYEKGWQIVNDQLSIQGDRKSDPAWIQTKETKYQYKSTISTPKKGVKKPAWKGPR